MLEAHVAVGCFKFLSIFWLKIYIINNDTDSVYRHVVGKSI